MNLQQLILNQSIILSVLLLDFSIFIFQIDNYHAAYS